MSTLLARLSAAKAGSRDLDAEVAIACGWTRVDDNLYANSWRAPNDTKLRRDESPLTTDLTTIVGEIERQGFLWLVGRHGTADVWRQGGFGERPTSRAATPCLALCIALLKAKEANANG